MNSILISDDNLPTHLNKEIIIEILEFHKNIYTTIVQNKEISEIDYSYVTARIQDEVFLKYNVEFEEILAFSQKYGIIDKNKTQIELLNNFSNLVLKINVSMNN